MTAPASLLLRYRRRLIRKRLLWRAFRKRRELALKADRLSAVKNGDILCFTTLRNEATRLLHFLDHYRRLGVGHFFIVDNASDDDGPALLADQPDVSLWRTTASYRASRFGVDWLNWLKWRYAAGHWCVVADADETLIYPDHEARDLHALTDWLEMRGHEAMGALMLDLYPKGSADAHSYRPGQDPTDILNWFDAHGYWAQRQPKLDNLWLQGGVRARHFFAETPDRAPTLNKIPLIKWQRGYAFVNSTHSALPAHLNHTWETPVSGVLLHSKFLPGSAARARIEKARDEHFKVGTRYGDYYDALAEDPDLWCEESTRYTGWECLVELGLMQRGDW